MAGIKFDGIICIGGEDWWYHNRGHFDFQIMRRLAADWPVLFVNSLGVRVPSAGEGRQFVAKISRKLKSFSNGLVNVENRFWVFSPVVVPGTTGLKLSSWALAPQIRRAAARAGIRRPLVWIHCPAGAALLDLLPAAGIILQRTDRFEAFPEADASLVASQIARLKARADLVIYCAPHLLAEESGTVRRQLLVTHGADVGVFAAAGIERIEPADVANLPKPRVGFIGGIDAHTFDPALFVQVATRLPDHAFMLVGSCSLPADWCQLPNVHLLGRKPYEQVARYMASADVLIMPWNDSDWIKACNPIKLKEYLATGRPIVTTDFPALDGWRDLVTLASGPEAFAVAIRTAGDAHIDRAKIASRLATETWAAKAALIRAEVAAMGLDYCGSAPVQAAA